MFKVVIKEMEGKQDNNTMPKGEEVLLVLKGDKTIHLLQIEHDLLFYGTRLISLGLLCPSYKAVCCIEKCMSVLQVRIC